MADDVISDAKAFSEAFALAVTEQTTETNGLIAKKGKESLYGILEQVFPQVRPPIHLLDTACLPNTFSCF